MTIEVRLEAVLSSEGLVTRIREEVASVRLLSCVSSDMSFEVMRGCWDKKAIV